MSFFGRKVCFIGAHPDDIELGCGALIAHIASKSELLWSLIHIFDVIRSSHGFFPTFLVEVSEADVQKKIEALAQYQTYQDKYYFNPEVTRATLIRHGAMAERPFAEGFDILRIIGEFNCSG